MTYDEIKLKRSKILGLSKNHVLRKTSTKINEPAICGCCGKQATRYNTKTGCYDAIRPYISINTGIKVYLCKDIRSCYTKVNK